MITNQNRVNGIPSAYEYDMLWPIRNYSKMTLAWKQSPDIYESHYEIYGLYLNGSKSAVINFKSEFMTTEQAKNAGYDQIMAFTPETKFIKTSKNGPR